MSVQLRLHADWSPLWVPVVSPNRRRDIACSQETAYLVLTVSDARSWRPVGWPYVATFVAAAWHANQTSSGFPQSRRLLAKGFGDGLTDLSLAEVVGGVVGFVAIVDDPFGALDLGRCGAGEEWGEVGVGGDEIVPV